MSAKRALVVDDSKSARAFLSRVLERYDLSVDSVESAEQAIDYLKHQRPDVIFMDHLMPGMDGFQAVQSIKNNPRTATIPIMMYTSQAGELYLSQARALGAIGVLPKQIKHTDVSKALEQLRLLGEPKPESDIATIRAQTMPSANEEPVRGGTDQLPQLPPMAPEVRSLIDAMLRDHALEMRRFVVENLENNAERIVGDVRLMLKDDVAPPASARPGDSPVRSAWAWVAVLALLIAAIFAAQWWREATDRSDLVAQLNNAEAQLKTSDDRLSALEQQQTTPGDNAQNGSADPAAGNDANAAQLVDPVPFGELPLSGSRLDHIQALLTRLNMQGFHGTVAIRSFPGRFCLANSANDMPTLAPPDTPFAKCEQVGNPFDAATSASQRESVNFANMLAAWRKSANGAFDIQVSTGGIDELAVAYPAVSDALAAAEWNRAAAVNNRVEVRWQASH